MLRDMSKSSFDDRFRESSSRDLSLTRTRGANEELARILGGIGALPDPLPLSPRAHALLHATTLD
jgi:hypothetical protein